jgi:hypothetical protein
VSGASDLRDRLPELTLGAVEGVSAGSRFVKPISVGVYRWVRLGAPFFYGVGARMTKREIKLK